jgi:two-component sensor histidine kinase
VTNSIKHGFSPDKNGKITVQFKRAGLEYQLIVQDNGAGFSPDLNFEDSPSLGMELVHALTDQLDGVLKFNGDKGTCVNIQFKNVYYSPRY